MRKTTAILSLIIVLLLIWSLSRISDLNDQVLKCNVNIGMTNDNMVYHNQDIKMLKDALATKNVFALEGNANSIQYVSKIQGCIKGIDY